MYAMSFMEVVGKNDELCNGLALIEKVGEAAGQKRR
jgi:hypothetical protein